MPLTLTLAVLAACALAALGLFCAVLDEGHGRRTAALYAVLVGVVAFAPAVVWDA